MPSVSARQAKLMSAISHGWHAPMKHAPSLAVAQEFHAADKKAGKYMHTLGGLVEKYADGGPVDLGSPQVQKDLLTGRSAPPSSKSEHFMNLIAHAADRATATVTDDPHHALSRVAAGLASQVAGQSPSGRVEFGRRPNLVNEVKSLPAGLADLGTVGANVAGSLSDKYFPNAPGTMLPGQLSKFRDALDRLIAKHGDIAPASSREAEAGADRMHQAVNKAMGLSAPKGFTENAADALGTMLGQLPLPGAEAKTATKGTLSALAHAIPEYLGPTIRPSARNYLSGALGGGALGNLASMGNDSQTPLADNGSSMTKERFE